jgi:hypothetical protein
MAALSFRSWKKRMPSRSPEPGAEKSIEVAVMSSSASSVR